MAHKTGLKYTNHVVTSPIEDVVAFRRPKYFDLWSVGDQSISDSKRRKELLQAHFGDFRREDLA